MLNFVVGQQSLYLNGFIKIFAKKCDSFSLKIGGRNLLRKVQGAIKIEGGGIRSQKPGDIPKEGTRISATTLRPNTDEDNFKIQNY